MFTGIISNIATIKHTQKSDDGLIITFSRPSEWKDLKLGESISTDGVCLTVAAMRDTEYDCLLIPETLQKTIFGNAVPAKVNLERSMLASDRFGGHYVQAHVDGVGVVSKITESDGYRVYITFPEEYSSLVISKGSITVNGVALTIVDVADDSFSVALIPHTLENTTLGLLKVDDQVNIEFDILGKYVVNIMKQREQHAKS